MKRELIRFRAAVRRRMKKAAADHKRNWKASFVDEDSNSYDAAHYHRGELDAYCDVLLLFDALIKKD